MKKLKNILLAVVGGLFGGIGEASQNNLDINDGTNLETSIATVVTALVFWLMGLISDKIKKSSDKKKTDRDNFRR